MVLADASASLVFTFTDSAAAGCTIERCDPLAETLFGISVPVPASFPKFPFEVLTQESHAELSATLNGLMCGERRFVEHVFNLQQSGRIHWLLLQATALPESHPAQFRACVFSVSEAFAQHHARVNSAEFFMRLLDQLPDRFYYKDRESRYLGGNKAWRQQHQIEDMQQWMGKSDFDSPKFQPEQAEQLFREEQSMMASGIPIRTREMRHTKDGEIQYSDTIKTPVYDEYNNIVGLVGLTRDITQQVQTEHALALAKQQAEHATQAKSAFLAMMSHEIRTPMNGVVGCASLLAETALDEEQQQLVKTIRACSEGLLVIINDILDYSKIEAGQIQLSQHAFDLRELVEHALTLSGKSVLHKLVNLGFNIEPDVPRYLIGDSTRLRQVLLNLLSNAVKFTERGEVSVHVSCQEKQTNAKECQLLFSVKDTGIGITAEQHPQLFQVFSQVDNSITRKYGGTGLGLAISKKIIEQMNGAIWFESVPNEGSIFYFTAQLTIGEAPEESEPPAPPPPPLSRTTRILVVEDNSVNQLVIIKMLGKLGYTNITAVTDGSEAVNICQKIPVDIILMDIQMRIMDGYTATEIIRAQHKLGAPPWIIALTAGAQQADTDRAFAAGMDAFATKPIQLEELDRVLQHAEIQLDARNQKLFNPH